MLQTDSYPPYDQMVIFTPPSNFSLSKSSAETQIYLYSLKPPSQTEDLHHIERTMTHPYHLIYPHNHQLYCTAIVEIRKICVLYSTFLSGNAYYGHLHGDQYRLLPGAPHQE